MNSIVNNIIAALNADYDFASEVDGFERLEASETPELRHGHQELWVHDDGRAVLVELSGDDFVGREVAAARYLRSFMTEGGSPMTATEMIEYTGGSVSLYRVPTSATSDPGIWCSAADSELLKTATDADQLVELIGDLGHGYTLGFPIEDYDGEFGFWAIWTC